jgi:hypothetical protein
MPKSQAEALRNRRADLKRQLRSVDAELEAIERSCDHDWGAVVFDPVIHRGYRVEAVEAGSDSTPAYDVPGRQESRWRRRCRKCGRVEETKQTEEEVVKKPRW